MIRINNVTELELFLPSFSEEGVFIDLLGLALVWDQDGATIYEVPFSVWRSEGSPVRGEWGRRWG